MTNASMNTCCSDHNSVSALSAGTEPRTGLLTRLKTLPAFALKWLKQSYRVSQQREELAKMSDSQLEDIGLDRYAAQREAERAFWDFTFPLD